MACSNDGNNLYSAVGNRVACFDLVRSRSFTFPFEARRNIALLVLSPDGSVLLSIDDEGHLLVDDGESPRIIVAGDVVHATIRT